MQIEERTFVPCSDGGQYYSYIQAKRFVEEWIYSGQISDGADDAFEDNTGKIWTTGEAKILFGLN